MKVGIPLTVSDPCEICQNRDLLMMALFSAMGRGGYVKWYIRNGLQFTLFRGSIWFWKLPSNIYLPTFFGCVSDYENGWNLYIGDIEYRSWMVSIVEKWACLEKWHTFDHVTSGLICKWQFSCMDNIVALSQSRNPNKVKVRIESDAQQGHLLFTMKFF